MVAANKTNDTPNANVKPSTTATECGKPSRIGLLPNWSGLVPSQNCLIDSRRSNLIEIKDLAISHGGIFLGVLASHLRNSSGNFAMFAAIRRASWGMKFPSLLQNFVWIRL
jgi:hypothetical protein